MNICKWKFIDNETNDWESGCGKRHFMGNHRTPIENGFKVCTYCGERLAQDTAGYIPNYDHYNVYHREANMGHLLRKMGEIN